MWKTLIRNSYSDCLCIYSLNSIEPTPKDSLISIILLEILFHWWNEWSSRHIGLEMSEVQDTLGLVAQMVKHLPVMRETRVQTLGSVPGSVPDPLEKEMATHSSTLAWKIPWTEEAGRLQSMGSQRVGHDWATLLSFFLSLSKHVIA